MFNEYQYQESRRLIIFSVWGKQITIALSAQIFIKIPLNMFILELNKEGGSYLFFKKSAPFSIEHKIMHHFLLLSCFSVDYQVTHELILTYVWNETTIM